jgi:hypothetical protein
VGEAKEPAYFKLRSNSRPLSFLPYSDIPVIGAFFFGGLELRFSIFTTVSECKLWIFNIPGIRITVHLCQSQSFSGFVTYSIRFG